MPPVFISAALAFAEVITWKMAVMTAFSYGVGQYQQRRAERKTTDAYNTSLKDRLVMTATVDRARSRAYGRVRNVDGILFKATWGPKRAYYTWVVALAGHEIDGIEQIYFNDVPVTLDAQGFVLNEPWNLNQNAIRQAASIPAGSNSVTLPVEPAAGSVLAVAQTQTGDVTIPVTVVGNVVQTDSLYAGVVKQVLYNEQQNLKRAVVKLYNGGDGQDLSAALAADMPDLIVPGKHRFEGIACLRVDLYYDQDAFASGPPNPITAVFRGAKVYDWRLNRLPNPHYKGAAPGVGPGTDLSLSVNSPGIAAAVVGQGVEAGQRYVDVRITGTASSGAAFAYLRFAPSNGSRPDASPGQLWHAGVYCRRVAGASSFMPNLVLQAVALDGSPLGAVTVPVSPGYLSAGSLQQARCSTSLTLADPATARADSYLIFTVLHGETVDLTVRVGLATLSAGVGAVRWTDNPVLIARDWSAYANGGGLGPDDFWIDDFTAQANACEVQHNFVSVNQSGASVSTTRPLYTCNLVADTAADPLQTLQEICESMAGDYAWPGGRLTVDAGVWRAPSGTITSDWISDQGVIEAVKDAPLQGRVNVITPVIADAAKAYVQAPMPRVPAPAYIELDGGEEPREEVYLGVTDADHAAHIAGIHLRQPRAAATYTLPLKLLGLQCKLFETWSLNIPELGLTGQPFKLVAWKLDMSKALVLATFKSNPASIYDPDAEFRREDALPNNALPNPFRVPALGALTLESGTEHLLKRADGTVISRLCVKWPAVQDEAVLNHSAGIELRCGLVGSDPATWLTLTVPGADTQAYFDQVQDRRAYAVIARARNRLVAGEWGKPAVHVVVGKSQPPAAVAGLSLSVIPGALKVTRTPSTEADWAQTIYRYGVSFAAGTTIPGVADRNGIEWAWPPLGLVTVWAADVDTSGNIGPAVSAQITVTEANRGVNWSSVEGRPKTFAVRAQGHSASSLPAGWWVGLRNAETNAELYGVRRSYALYEMDRNGNEVFKRVYDVHGNGAVDGHTAATLAADLNYICDTRRGNFVVVYSHDEPNYLRLSSGLPAAMYRCGASRAVFGSSQFRIRAAYILVGVAGSGEGMGAEVYAGAVDSDPNAWCELGFQIQNGVLTVSGANGGARSLYDLGPVQTDNIAPNAATDIATGRVNDDTWTAPFLTNANKSYAEFTWTNNLDRSVTLELSATFARLYQITGSNPDQTTFFNSIGGQLTGPGGAFASFSYPDYLSPLATQVMPSGSADQKSYSLVTSIDVPVGWSVVAGCNLNAIRASAFSGDVSVRTFGLSFRVVKVKA